MNAPASLPEVADLLASLRAQSLDPLEANRRITRAHALLARAFQAILDPAFGRGGGCEVSPRRPSWYGFAPHSSNEVGRGLRAAGLALRLLDGLREGRAVAPGLAPAPMALLAPVRSAGLPDTVAEVLAVMLAAGNLRALEDPRTGVATGLRMARLFAVAPGSEPLARCGAVVSTLRNTLAQGNREVFGDVAGAGLSYLLFRAASGAVDPEEVLARFRVDGSVPAQAHQVFAYAVSHAADPRQRTDLDVVFAGVERGAFLVAGFALYEQARQLADPRTADALIGFANNLLAFREQHDVLAVAFASSSTQPGEVDREAVLALVTPTIRLPVGPALTWTFTDYVSRLPDPDGDPLTSPATEYNWGTFRDRWPAIVDCFDAVYRAPEVVWPMPEPLPPG